MSHEKYRLRYQAAETYRMDGRNEAAGTTFSLAAYELLGGSELGDRNELLTAVTTLTEAAICYRIGGHDRRCSIRCRQGESVVDELDALLYEREPFEALAHELRGDFRLIAGRKGHRKHHRRARAIYAEYEDESDRWQGTDEFEAALDPFLKAADAVGHQYDHYQPLDDLSLLSRLFEKKYHFGEVLRELERAGTWNWDR
ncbi:hypothetical protein JCM30237_04050 [Halolamina litorea]|uniref:Uncharacterized protein n=1 Tax=Halolamina litorea TaxID=1515593 RepID=A0ABD6BNW9_9EURY|nr:hypothetical protein [Halolamina litorea]